MLEYLFIISINIMSNVFIILSALIMLLICKINNKVNKKSKRNKYKKIKPGFYNTGYKFSFSLKDIIKFKLRLLDYCDYKGIRFDYLIAIKIFNYEFCRMKYTDQKGLVYKRKIRFGV